MAEARPTGDRRGRAALLAGAAVLAGVTLAGCASPHRLATTSDVVAQPGLARSTVAVAPLPATPLPSSPAAVVDLAPAAGLAARAPDPRAGAPLALAPVAGPTAGPTPVVAAMPVEPRRPVPVAFAGPSATPLLKPAEKRALADAPPLDLARTLAVAREPVTTGSVPAAAPAAAPGAPVVTGSTPPRGPAIAPAARPAEATPTLAEAPQGLRAVPAEKPTRTAAVAPPKIGAPPVSPSAEEVLDRARGRYEGPEPGPRGVPLAGTGTPIFRGLTSAPVEPVKQRLALRDVVAQAVGVSPDIGSARAREAEAVAGIDAARAARRPTMEARLGAGHNTIGSYENQEGLLYDRGGSAGAIRVDTVLSIRQRLLDFGVVANDVLRTKESLDAERYRRLDKIEEVTRDMVRAYLSVIEKRELLAAADANVAAHKRLAKLVEANQQAGNGTVADVSRISAKLIETESTRTDLKADLEDALDRFRRLSRLDPRGLSAPPSFAAVLPKTPSEAIGIVPKSNPKLLAMEAVGRSMQAEEKSARGEYLPKLDLEMEAGAKNYFGTNSRTELDVRGMVVMRHKLMDGGARRAAIDQIKARQLDTEMRYINERDDVEADIRQFYRQLDSARSKAANLAEGVASSKKVTELYIEQFTAGKRTVFELLDSQTSLYQAQKELITNQFEERRAIFGILRSMGRLTETILAAAPFGR